MAIDHINSASALLKYPSPNSSNRGELPFDIPSVLGELVNPFAECKMLAVPSLFERPWWNRRWIIQEVVMAKVITVQCGIEVILVRVKNTRAFKEIEFEASGV